MQGNHNINEKRWTARALSCLFYLLSFVLPCAIALISLWYAKLWPFGDQTISVWDLQITYTNSYEYLKSCLTGDQNIFYSFYKSLGGSMFAGWASILTSPINLSIVFFSENPIDFITFMVIVKFGLAGVTSFFYARHRFKLNRVMSLALSIGYALMLFMTTQSANPFWMDVVILLPLVLYGVYRVVTKGKMVLLYVSLILTIFCNYYNGYMVCIFCILFYLFESFLYAPRAKRVRLKIMVNPGRFSIAFALAVFSSLVILLPVVFGLSSGKGAVPEGLFDVGARYDLGNVVRSFFLGVYEKELLPQFYCGTFALLGAIWFFLHKEIGKREKIAFGILFGFMIVSTWFAPLDRFWLGLRDGNFFYCRFSFFVSALMFFATARALIASNYGKTSFKQLMIAAGFVAIVACVIYCEIHLPGKIYLFANVILAVALPTALFGIVRFEDRPLVRTGIQFLLILVVCVEGFFTCFQIFSYRSDSDNPNYYSQMESYFSEGHDAIGQINGINGAEADAFRVEKTYNLLSQYRRIALNESWAFGYPGIASYDSTYDDKVQNVLYRFGYTPDSGIRTSYNYPMIVPDSLLGVRYVFSDTCPAGFVEVENSAQWGQGTYYENPYALPLGYVASQDILQNITFDGNPFHYQNEFVNRLIGSEVNCVNDLQVEKQVPLDGTWTWTVDTSGVPQGDIVYGFFQYRWSVISKLYIDGEYVADYLTEWSQGGFPIPADGGVHTISLTGLTIPETADDLVLKAASVDMKSFESAMDQLRSSGMAVSVFEGGHVEASCSSASDGILFTTIPYESGWAVSVNGKDVDTSQVQDAFLAIPLSSGTNEIVMEYSPRGITAGAAASLACVFVFIVVTCVLYRKDKKAVAK